jgi:hypothetical protein
VLDLPSQPRWLRSLARLAGRSPFPGEDDLEGFVTPEQCAREMEITIDDVHLLARIGWLEHREMYGGRVLIRPAIVEVGRRC